jgi:hypothetical protein
MTTLAAGIAAAPRVQALPRAQATRQPWCDGHELWTSTVAAQ